MNENINKIQDRIIEDFSRFDNLFDKYEYLIKLGKNLAPLDEKLKTNDNSISGCQSQVWLKAEIKMIRYIFWPIAIR